MTCRCWMPLVALAASIGLLPGCCLFSRSKQCDGCPRKPALSREQEFFTSQPFSQDGAGPAQAKHEPNQGATPPESQPLETQEEPEPVPVQQTSFPKGRPAETDASVNADTSQVPAPFLPGLQPEAGPPELGATAVRADRIPERREPPLVEALRCILENRPHDALPVLETYDRTTQDFVMRVLPVLALVQQKPLDQLKAEEVAVLHEQVQSLLALLRPRTEFAIGKICFCEWIKGFGFYKPQAADHVFLSSSGGRPGELVQVYIELKNFCTEYRQPFHETRLAVSAEIYDQKGKRWWRDPAGERKQPILSQDPLNDYCAKYTFYVPELPPGSYLLTIQVADETRPDFRRVARKSLEFRVTNLQIRGN
jgi:hypothetical protein